MTEFMLGTDEIAVNTIPALRRSQSGGEDIHIKSCHTIWCDKCFDRVLQSLL